MTLTLHQNWTRNENGDSNGQLDQAGNKNGYISLNTNSISSSLSAPKMFVKGVGSLMTIHFTGPHKAMLQGLFYHHMLKKNIYLAQGGFVALSTEIKDEHIDHFVES